MFLAPLFWFLSRPIEFRKYIYQNKQLRLSLCIPFFFFLPPFASKRISNRFQLISPPIWPEESQGALLGMNLEGRFRQNKTQQLSRCPRDSSQSAKLFTNCPESLVRGGEMRPRPSISYRCHLLSWLQPCPACRGQQCAPRGACSTLSYSLFWHKATERRHVRPSFFASPLEPEVRAQHTSPRFSLTLVKPLCNVLGRGTLLRGARPEKTQIPPVECSHRKTTTGHCGLV